MKTLVFGAGPLGSLLAGRLHKAGVDVSILARGQRLADLREHGVVLEDAHSGDRESYPVPVVEEPGGDKGLRTTDALKRTDRTERPEALTRDVRVDRGYRDRRADRS